MTRGNGTITEQSEAKRRRLATEAAVGAVDEMEGAGGDEEQTLSNGLRVRLTGMPPGLSQAVMTRNPRPQVPRIHIEEQDRWEDNFNDPNYAEAVSQWEALGMEAVADAALLTGVEVIEVPPGVYPLESDEWMADLIFLGVDIDASNARARKIAWLRCYALPTMSDLALVIGTVIRLSGLTDAEVQATVETFRTRAARRASNGRRAAST